MDPWVAAWLWNGIQGTATGHAPALHAWSWPAGDRPHCALGFWAPGSLRIAMGSPEPAAVQPFAGPGREVAAVAGHRTVSVVPAGGHRALWLHPAPTSVGVSRVPQITWSGAKGLPQGATDWGAPNHYMRKQLWGGGGLDPRPTPTPQKKERAPAGFFVPSSTCPPRGEAGGAELLPGAKPPRVCCFTGAADPPQG